MGLCQATRFGSGDMIMGACCTGNICTDQVVYFGHDSRPPQEKMDGAWHW